MRKAIILITVLLACVSAVGQSANPPISPGDATNPVPTITFSQNWPEAIPPFYSIAIAANGQASYQATPKANNEGDPYLVKFEASAETKAKLFDLAKALNHFNGNWNYKKNRIAFTGDKTLTYKNGIEEYRTTYNWSDNLQIQKITSIFQGISETVELGRLLTEKYRFDKLGVDAELKKLESAAKAGRLEEIQAIQPILSKIAKDSSMMNITRRRAEFLLSKIQKAAVVQGQL